VSADLGNLQPGNIINVPDQAPSAINAPPAAPLMQAAPPSLASPTVATPATPPQYRLSSATDTFENYAYGVSGDLIGEKEARVMVVDANGNRADET
jgi:hypothetical protein